MGHLSHAATVVRPGRAFLQDLFALLKVALQAPHHFIHLTAGASTDIAWWCCFLQEWNGTSFFSWPRQSPHFHVFSDAAESQALASLLGGFNYHGPAIGTTQL